MHYKCMFKKPSVQSSIELMTKTDSEGLRKLKHSYFNFSSSVLILSELDVTSRKEEESLNHG